MTEMAAVKEHEMAAKFPGKCTACGGGISAGASILWAKGAGARHKDCGAAETVLVTPAGSATVCACGAVKKPQYATCYRCKPCSCYLPERYGRVDTSRMRLDPSCRAHVCPDRSEERRVGKECRSRG